MVIRHRAELIFFSSGCRSWKLRLYFDYGSRLLSVIQAAGSGIMVWAIFTWHHLIIIYEIWVAFIHLKSETRIHFVPLHFPFVCDQTVLFFTAL